MRRVGQNIIFYPTVNYHDMYTMRYGITHTHTQLFNGPLSGTTRVSRLQKGKTSLDFIEARKSESQWHQLGHMQVCTLPQTDNHASTPPPMRYGIDITIFDTMHCITSTLYLMAGN